MVTNYSVIIGALPPIPPLPDASNSGVDPDLTLTDWTGGATLLDSQSVIEGVRFGPSQPGRTVVGTNLTLRQCLIDGWLAAQGDGLILEDCTVTGGVTVDGVAGARFTRCDLSGGTDVLAIGGDSSDVVAEFSYLHDPTLVAGQLSDIVQAAQVAGLTLHRCNLDLGTWFQVGGVDVKRSAVSLASMGVSDVDIESCRLNGGQTTLAFGQVDGLWRLVNTVFGPDWHDAVYAGTPPPDIQSGNTLEADGSPVVIA